MYTLLVAEKPSVAKKIAESLADDKPQKFEENGVKFYDFTRNKKRHMAVSAVGHLYALKQKTKGWKYPVFDIEWIPAADANKSAEFSRKYLEAIIELAKDADDYYICTDYDTEGELIGQNILKFACNSGALKKAKRMHFSAITKDSLIEAYESAGKPDLNLGKAGETRHILDWYWGINITRALSISLNKATGGFRILSTGRVQGPTLAILSEREKEIKAFIPEPFWQIELEIEKDGKKFKAMHEQGNFTDKKKAAKAYRSALKGKTGKIVDLKKRNYKQSPPNPFDLTKLLTESNRCFGYEPKQTQQIAQKLYEKGYISYPRTSSQKLPEKIGFKKIIEGVRKVARKYDLLGGKLLKECKELVPNNGKKDDPAHPAIYPTGEKPARLNDQQAKIYDLIIKQIFATFSSPAIREKMTVNLDVGGEQFKLEGSKTKEENWHVYYKPYVGLKEEELPEFSIGEQVEIDSVSLLDKETQPPSRYSGAGIIKKMETEGIGTKATRAGILGTLASRSYITGKSIQVTELGLAVDIALEKYCKDVVATKLTKRFENEVEQIQKGKLKEEKVLSEARDELSKVLSKFTRHEKAIGSILMEAFIHTRRNAKVLGECPGCGGIMKVITSRATGKRFAGCGNYPKCTTSFPLPQEGEITALKTKCKTCAHPMIYVKREGKRPYRMCILHTCESKKPKEDKEQKGKGKAPEKSKEKTPEKSKDKEPEKIKEKEKTVAE